MTSSVVADLTLVVVFVLIGGLFAASEIALVSLNEGRIQAISRRGRRGARTAALARNPNRFLSAVQIGVTVAGFFSAAYGASALAPHLVPALELWGLSAGAASGIALVATTLVIAYVSLVIGELVPKRLALQRATGLALLVGPALDRFATVMRPVIALLSASTDGVVRVLGGDPGVRGESVTYEDLRDLVHYTPLPEHERQLLADVFTAAERTLGEVMTPRTEVIFLEASDRVADVRGSALQAGHIRYPVTGRSLDDVVGVVHVRDLVLGDDESSVADVCNVVLHLPVTLPALEVLHDLRHGYEQFAIVVDEYGGTAGIVTLEDIVEEIIGDVGDRISPPLHPEPGPHGIPVDGLTIIEEFTAETGIEIPDGSYDTVAGFLQDRLQKVPEVGDGVVLGRYRLVVDSLDGRRVAGLVLFTVDDAPSTDEDRP